MTSALYVGAVTHTRLRPRRHRLRYRALWLLAELDELPALHARLRLFSHNRFNLFALHDRDHGDGGGMRAHVERLLAAERIPFDGGRVLLLTMPRVLGYVFNPLSVYFCHARDGRLVALVYEVRNTFGGMHTYAMPVTTQDGAIRQICRKRFYVSPFMPMDLDYNFRVLPPCERVTIAIAAHDAQGPMLAATLSGERRALGDPTLARLFLTHPLLTLKVIAGIHWEAAKMFAKGLRPSPRRFMDVQER